MILMSPNFKWKKWGTDKALKKQNMIIADSNNENYYLSDKITILYASSDTIL